MKYFVKSFENALNRVKGSTVFFLPNNMKRSSNVPAGMDARFWGEARELGFLHACFPSESFQTRPINKEPPFLHRLQRSRSSSTHATIHINQTSALHHNVCPALELWISCKQIIRTIRRLLLSEADSHTKLTLVLFLLCVLMTLAFISRASDCWVASRLVSAAVFCTDFFLYSVFHVSGKCFQVLLPLLLSNYWSLSFLFTLNHSAKQSYEWLWRNTACSTTLTCCLYKRH